MFRFLIPVSGSILSVIFLKEKLTLNVALSLIFIVAGIILVNKEPKKSKTGMKIEKSIET
jgi:drug/metabolite transporter (DMT)-like permease